MQNETHFDKIWSQYPDLAIGPSPRLRVRTIKSLMKHFDRKKSILDVGCGRGLMLKELSHMGFERLCGMDTSDVALDAVKQIPNEVTRYKANIMTGEGLPDHRFDVIICSEVLEHLQDDKAALSNMNKLIVPGGSLILTVPYGQSNWTKHDEAIGHYRRYSRGELEEKLKSSGYEIDRSIVWGWPLYYLYWRLLLSNASPEKSWKAGGILKNIVSSFLYQIFKVDDLFMWTGMGMRQIVIARRMNH